MGSRAPQGLSGLPKHLLSMRPKVVIPVLALGAALLLLFVLLWQRFGAPVGPFPAQSLAAEAKGKASNPERLPPGTVKTRNGGADPEPDASRPRAGSNVPPADSAETRHAVYVGARIGELLDLAMNDDPASLESILSELNNPDPEIRKGALEAAVQFGNRDAIPRLAEARARTDDPEEKSALANAIEFLKLPSLTEIANQSKDAATPPPK